MRPLNCAALTTLILTATLPVTGFAQVGPPAPNAFSFTTFDVPGAAGWISVGGINTSGVVVGSYADSQDHRHGFIRNSNGSFSFFDVPGAVNTYLTGINDGADISGYWSDPAGNTYAFLRMPDGTTVPRTIPGANSVMTAAINNLRQIVGAYQGSGVLFNADGGFSLFNVPPSWELPGSRLTTAPTGINDSGGIIGNYCLMISGWCYTGIFFSNPLPSFTKISDAVSLGPTAVGMTNLVHTATTTSNGLGSVISLGGAVSIPMFFGIPGASSLTVGGISNADAVTGVYRSGSPDTPHGFIGTPCAATIATTSASFPVAGGTGQIQVTAPAGCTWAAQFSDSSFAWVDGPAGSNIGVGSGVLRYIVSANNVTSFPRQATINIAGQIFTISQTGSQCSVSLESTSANVPASGGQPSFKVIAPDGCPWTVVSANPDWLFPLAGAWTFFGSASVDLTALANTGQATRTGSVTVGGQRFYVNQAGGASCSYTSGSSSGLFGPNAGTGNILITTGPFCPWLSVSVSVPWLHIWTETTRFGNQPVFFDLDANPFPQQRSGTLTAGSVVFTITQQGSPVALRFVPLAPCRLVDTRPGGGTTGAFGPPSFSANGTRDFPLFLGRCNIPANAAAYSLNVTAVPPGGLSYLTVWPTGQPRPWTSTLNSWNGRVVANAAIVPAGAQGSVSVYASDATDVVIDINGYFVPATDPTGLAFYPVTPCRVFDSRFGSTSLQGGAKRDINVVTSTCGIPASARAYSLNVTAVPPSYLGYLTIWPAGQAQPNVSTLNSWNGQVVPNAAIVPASANGAVSVFVSNTSDVVIDINGYFAPPGAPGALNFYPIAPCRVADTRPGAGFTGAFGTPSIPSQGTRSFYVPDGACFIPSTARAYAINVTAVPPAYLGFVTLFPMGQSMPTVSTLNSWDGQVVANLAIVPVGTNGWIALYASNATDIVLDISGYFAQ